MASRDSLPISLCIVGSLAIHAAVVLPMLGAALGGGLASAAIDAPAEEPEPAPPKRDAPPEPPPDIPLPPEIRRPLEAERVTLGIDDGSDQPLVTWIGYDEYERHLARLSEVEQAAMRMTPEGGGEPATAPPGAMSTAAPNAPAPPSETAPAAIASTDMASDIGQPPSLQPKAEPVPTPPNAPPEPERVTDATPPSPTPPLPEPAPIETTPKPTEAPPAPAPPMPAPGLALPRPADPPVQPDGAPLPPEPAPNELPKPDPIVRPVEGAGEDEKPPLPDAAREEAAPAPEAPPTPAPEPNAEIAPRSSETAPPASQPQPLPTPIPENEERVPPHDQPERSAPPAPPRAPGATPQPEGDAGAPNKPAAAPGPPATGELTEQEADPTSTIDVPPDQWRNGKPLAARGLQLLTRRPELLPEYLAVQTSAARNPVFELSFDHLGVVRRVVMIEGSGAATLDDRLIDALYKWRARGARLKEVKPGDRLKFTMRMLVR